MTKKTVFLAGALLCGAVFAGEVYKADIKNLQPAGGIKEKDGSFSVQSKRAWVNGKGFFAVDPAKKYTVSGEFRFLGTPPRSFSLGLALLTAKNQPIPPASIHAVPGTETTLAAPAAVGDKSIKVAAAEKWDNRTPVSAAVFNIKDGYADFPNYTYVATKKGSIKKAGDVWEIELGEPLKKAYPAGTRIRQHLFGGTFLYTTVKLRNFSSDWQAFSGSVTGMTENARSDKQFWPRTAKARVIILTSGGADDSVLEFRNLKVEVAE